METTLLEKKVNQKEIEFVIMRCYQTGNVLVIPKRVYEQVEKKDKSVADKEFQGFYVSPGFCFYKSYSDFRMFCED
jgi:hypothetical protein